MRNEKQKENEVSQMNRNINYEDNHVSTNEYTQISGSSLYTNYSFIVHCSQ